MFSIANAQHHFECRISIKPPPGWLDYLLTLYSTLQYTRYFCFGILLILYRLYIFGLVFLFHVFYFTSGQENWASLDRSVECRILYHLSKLSHRNILSLDRIPASLFDLFSFWSIEKMAKAQKNTGSRYQGFSYDWFRYCICSQYLGRPWYKKNGKKKCSKVDPMMR